MRHPVAIVLLVLVGEEPVDPAGRPNPLSSVDQTGVDFQLQSLDRGRCNRNSQTGISDSKRPRSFRNRAKTKCKIALTIRADTIRPITDRQDHLTPADWPTLLVCHAAGDRGLTRQGLALYRYESAKHL